MPASIGVNLRVTGHCRQGGRKYMEDFFSVAYQQTEDERDLEYAFFGIYDGHGGPEAAAYAKEHLMELIVRQKSFWSDNDDDVLRAIKDGYIATHYAMWQEHSKWPKTASGLPSTAGTTASVAFIRRGKIYIGHVGDSGIVLGYQVPDKAGWQAKPLTKDHKPDSAAEMLRIEQSGGKVMARSGVPRVVWNRPRQQGPVRRSTPIDEIPFLAIARSLGDLWSYNSQLDEFVVSPVPDCCVIPIETSTFRCLIFGTDGLYNMLSPPAVVHIVQQAERHNEDAALGDDPNMAWLNPSKCLVEKALDNWSYTKVRADNTSVITLLLDPPGPPKAQVLKSRKRKAYPDSGLEIVTRYKEETTKRACSEPSSSLTTSQKPQVKESPTTLPKPKRDVEVGEKSDTEDISTAATTVAADEDAVDEKVQIHEISSSCEVSLTEGEEKPATRTRYERGAKKSDAAAVTTTKPEEGTRMSLRRVQPAETSEHAAMLITSTESKENTEVPQVRETRNRGRVQPATPSKSGQKHKLPKRNLSRSGQKAKTCVVESSTRVEQASSSGSGQMEAVGRWQVKTGEQEKAGWVHAFKTKDIRDILRQKNAAALESHARLAKTSAKKPPAAAAPPRPKSNADLRRSLRSSLGPRASSSPGKLEKATRGPAAKARSVTRTSLKRGRR